MTEFLCIYGENDSFHEMRCYEEVTGPGIRGPMVKDNFGRGRSLTLVQGTEGLYTAGKYYFRKVDDELMHDAGQGLEYE